MERESFIVSYCFGSFEFLYSLCRYICMYVFLFKRKQIQLVFKTEKGFKKKSHTNIDITTYFPPASRRIDVAHDFIILCQYDFLLLERIRSANISYSNALKNTSSFSDTDLESSFDRSLRKA